MDSKTRSRVSPSQKDVEALGQSGRDWALALPTQSPGTRKGKGATKREVDTPHPTHPYRGHTPRVMRGQRGTARQRDSATAEGNGGGAVVRQKYGAACVKLEPQLRKVANSALTFVDDTADVHVSRMD